MENTKTFEEVKAASDSAYMAWKNAGEREACRKRHAEKSAKKKDPNSLSNLPFGAMIRVTMPNGNIYDVTKMPPNHQFKTYWFKGNGGYLPKSWIKEYIVISIPA